MVDYSKWDRMAAEMSNSGSEYDEEVECRSDDDEEFDSGSEEDGPYLDDNENGADDDDDADDDEDNEYEGDEGDGDHFQVYDSDHNVPSLVMHNGSDDAKDNAGSPAHVVKNQKESKKRNFMDTTNASTEPSSNLNQMDAFHKTVDGLIRVRKPFILAEDSVLGNGGSNNGLQSSSIFDSSSMRNNGNDSPNDTNPTGNHYQPPFPIGEISPALKSMNSGGSTRIRKKFLRKKQRRVSTGMIGWASNQSNSPSIGAQIPCDAATGAVFDTANTVLNSAEPLNHQKEGENSSFRHWVEIPPSLTNWVGSLVNGFSNKNSSNGGPKDSIGSDDSKLNGTSGDGEKKPVSTTSEESKMVAAMVLSQTIKELSEKEGLSGIEMPDFSSLILDAYSASNSACNSKPAKNEEPVKAAEKTSSAAYSFSLPETLPMTMKQLRSLDPLYQLNAQELPMVIGYSPYCQKIDILPPSAYVNPDDDKHSVLSEVFTRVKNHLPEDAYPDHYCPTDDSEDEDIELLPEFGKPERPQDILYKQISDYALRSIQRKRSSHPSFAMKQKETIHTNNSVPYFVIHIRLCGIRPAVWRRVRVPSNLSLSMFHDKVICPVFGWCRNYHAYMFTLPTIMYSKNKKPHPRNDISFGPVRAKSVDLIHRMVRRGGACMVDDTKVGLMDLLKSPGQYLKYLYDLGDAWKHKITLEAIVPNLEDDDEKFAVLDGYGSCPAEDCGSMFTYCQKLSDMANPGGENFKEAIESVYHAKNKVDCVRSMLKNGRIDYDYYDPFYFKLEDSQKALEKALISKSCYIDDANTVRWTVKENGDIVPQKVCRKVGPVKTCSFCNRTEAELKKSSSKGNSASRATGTLNDSESKLKVCGRCRHVHYCSLTCQHDDWSNHQKVCVMIDSGGFSSAKVKSQQQQDLKPPSSGTNASNVTGAARNEPVHVEADKGKKKKKKGKN